MQKKVNLKIEKAINIFSKCSHVTPIQDMDTVWFTWISELPDPSNAAHNAKIIVSLKPKYVLNNGRMINNPIVTKTLKYKR